MADISKLTLLNGTTYDLKDAQARSDIEDIKGAIAGGVTFMGETTTALTDGATTNPITINNKSVSAIKGYLVVYNSKEFVFDGTKWIEMGDLSVLGALAYKDSASGSFTPSGSVSQPTFTGTATTIKPKVTAAGTVAISKGTGTANYTPEGSVAAPTISVKTAGATTTVNSITAVGTLPSLTTTVANEVLTIGFDQGTLPTKGANTTVKTGDAAYQASAPAFTGTGAELKATFTGTEVEGSASYTPAGTVSKPTFAGTAGTVTVS